MNLKEMVIAAAQTVYPLLNNKQHFLLIGVEVNGDEIHSRLISSLNPEQKEIVLDHFFKMREAGLLPPVENMIPIKHMRQ
jgi:hypothetical protein